MIFRLFLFSNAKHVVKLFCGTAWIVFVVALISCEEKNVDSSQFSGVDPSSRDYFFDSIVNKTEKQKTSLDHNIPVPNFKDSVLVEELVFGFYCGNCLSHCSSIFRLSNKGQFVRLHEDLNQNPFGQYMNFEFESDITRAELVQPAFEVMWAIPDILIQNKSYLKTYGCPDCYDQCGVIVEFKLKNEKSKRFFLDWSSNRDDKNEITEFALMIKHKIGEMNRLKDW